MRELALPSVEDVDAEHPAFEERVVHARGLVDANKQRGRRRRNRSNGRCRHAEPLSRGRGRNDADGARERAHRASEVAGRCLSHAGFLVVVESANVGMIRANATVVNALIQRARSRMLAPSF